MFIQKNKYDCLWNLLSNKLHYIHLLKCIFLLINSINSYLKRKKVSYIMKHPVYIWGGIDTISSILMNIC